MFINHLELPSRTKKPREKGLTSIMDLGLATGEMEPILKDYHDYIDIAKLGIGTAAVTPDLEKKISLYHKYDIKVYFGGTLFEKFHFQQKLTVFKNILLEYDVDFVEISNGTIDLSLSERKDLISFFTESNIDVLCEVGNKDKRETMSPTQWIKEIKSFLNKGAKYIITEGRNSGTAGIFRPSGELRTDLVNDIIRNITPSKIIIEAPTSKSQMFLMNLIGSNVNLGNVSPHDLLAVEAERLGLRSETFEINS